MATVSTYNYYKSFLSMYITTPLKNYDNKILNETNYNSLITTINNNININNRFKSGIYLMEGGVNKGIGGGNNTFIITDTNKNIVIYDSSKNNDYNTYNNKIVNNISDIPLLNSNNINQLLNDSNIKYVYQPTKTTSVKTGTIPSKIVDGKYIRETDVYTYIKETIICFCLRLDNTEKTPIALFYIKNIQ